MLYDRIVDVVPEFVAKPQHITVKEHDTISISATVKGI